MKNTLVTILTIMLAVCVLTGNVTLAQSGGTLPAEVMQGTVAEAEDDALLIRSVKGTLVSVRITDKTVIGLPQYLVPGAVIRVTYDGLMSRSVPAVIYADQVECMALEGVAEESDESSFILAVSEQESYRVYTEQLPSVGSRVTVYGAMKDDGSVDAWHVRGRTIQVQVTGREEDRLICEADGSEIVVLLTEQTVQVIQPEVGMKITVAAADEVTAAGLPQYTALEILPAV